MFQVLMGIGFIQGIAQEFLSDLHQGVQLAEITSYRLNRLGVEGDSTPKQKEKCRT